jgi:hypothetical protein
MKSSTLAIFDGAKQTSLGERAHQYVVLERMCVAQAQPCEPPVTGNIG